MLLLADMSLDIEPVWPWSLPTLFGAALVLASLTIWTYLGVKKATWRRVGVVLFLRLSALVVAFGMIMRPSFGFTQLEGVELTKLLVLFDASESMNAADIEGKPTRWQQVNTLWASRDVQHRLDQLRSEQKIEIVKYLGAENLRADEPIESANGKRTDLGAWLHQLWTKHGHEKHTRGVLLFSDGADNGTRFSASEEARQWRGVAPIHTFGVGDPSNLRFRKDIGLTSLRVEPGLIPVQSMMTVKAVVQAAGFKEADVEAVLSIEDTGGKKAPGSPAIRKFHIVQEKDQPIEVKIDAPETPGEYKLTLTITPHADEANKANNEMTTYVQVIKPKINVLWVDRPRVYEPTHAIRFGLAPDKRLAVYHVMPPADEKGDPFELYEFHKRHYDVIIIGDISARQFSLGDSKIFAKIHEMVIEQKTGLLMLGGTETFAKGGWRDHPPLAELLPVKLGPAKTEYVKGEFRVVPAKGAPALPFLQLELDAKKNHELWTREFEPLEGLAPVGELLAGSTPLLTVKGRETEVAMAATRQGNGGHVVVFAADSTDRAWRTSKDAVVGYKKFWRQLVLWLADQKDQDNQLVIDLDKRRLNANAGDILGFAFSLRGQSGDLLSNVSFKATVVGPTREYAVVYGSDDRRLQRGTFQGPKEAGEHRLVVVGVGAELDGKKVEVETVARFLVAFDDIEMQRPLAEHETLGRIAANAEGRFFVLAEQPLLQVLDEVRNQVNRESRHKTTYWPDWKRLPASEHGRDQLAGLWNSFALVSFVLFITLLGCEWFLRRFWGLV